MSHKGRPLRRQFVKQAAGVVGAATQHLGSIVERLLVGGGSDKLPLSATFQIASTGEYEP